MRLRVLLIASILSLLCSALAKADANWSMNSPFLKAIAASEVVSSTPVAARIKLNQPSIAFRTLALAAQQPGEQPKKDVKIEVKVDRGGGGDWYKNPVWIAIGILGFVVLVLLIGFAIRGSGSPTVVSK
jgi:hypothetical protein